MERIAPKGSYEYTGARYMKSISWHFKLVRIRWFFC